MFAEDVVLFGDDGFPGRRVIGTPLATGAQLELQPALVVLIVRIPEGFGSAEWMRTGYPARRTFPRRAPASGR